jgi:hypothetical protein
MFYRSLHFFAAAFALITFFEIDASYAFRFLLPKSGREISPTLTTRQEEANHQEASIREIRLRDKDECVLLSRRRSIFSGILIAVMGQEGIKPVLAASNIDCLEECLRECYGVVPNPKVSIFKCFLVIKNISWHFKKSSQKHRFNEELFLSSVEQRLLSGKLCSLLR